MAYISRDKLFSKVWFKNYSLIVAGSFILAAGFVFFISPHKIVPGGVYGISIVIHHITKGVFAFAPSGLPIGLMGLILNIPLTLLGIKILGPRFGIKTIIGFILTSLFIDLLTLYWGDQPLVEEDALLSSIFGGLLIGFGLGLIFKTKATSGGSDIIAMIFAKYTKLPVGRLLIYVDSVIVLVGLIAFRDWKIPLYSWIVIYITGKVIDTTMHGIDYDKAVLIISNKYEEIRKKILFELNRGATMIPVKGMYQHQERKMIFTDLNRRELAILQEYIREIDEDAFMTVLDANMIVGDGFRSFNDV
jgi:uncharacterized membrane-anchored protein YitT (DUF2179 family)